MSCRTALDETGIGEASMRSTPSKTHTTYTQSHHMNTEKKYIFGITFEKAKQINRCHSFIFYNLKDNHNWDANSIISKIPLSNRVIPKLNMYCCLLFTLSNVFIYTQWVSFTFLQRESINHLLQIFLVTTVAISRVCILLAVQ